MNGICGQKRLKAGGQAKNPLRAVVDGNIIIESGCDLPLIADFKKIKLHPDNRHFWK